MKSMENPHPTPLCINGEPSAVRSALMAKVRSKDTKPELAVRRFLHKAGVRFRLQRRDLPGTPDLVLPRAKIAMFVHGCFWHRHDGCKRTTTPKTRVDFWRSKFEANQARDYRVRQQLEAAGWDVIIVWECETLRADALSSKLAPLISRNAMRHARPCQNQD